MLELLKLLLEPRVLSLIGPLGLVAVVEGIALYKMFKKYDELQEKRIDEWKAMKEEYTQLSADINRTLELLIKMLPKKNGNGNGA